MTGYSVEEVFNKLLLFLKGFIVNTWRIRDEREAEIPRPQGENEQQEKEASYGQKYRYCVSQTVAGRVHDRAMAGTAYTIPPGFTLYQDSGYRAIARQR